MLEIQLALQGKGQEEGPPVQQENSPSFTGTFPLTRVLSSLEPAE